MRAWRINFTFIDIFASERVLIQLHALGTGTIEAKSGWDCAKNQYFVSQFGKLRISPADGVQAVMTARVRQMSAFIDIGATDAVVRQLISGSALTVE